MKYQLTINQQAAISNGLNLDIIDLAIFDFIKSYSHSSKCEKKHLSDGTYFNISHKTIIKELPVLGITTTRGILVHINKLIRAGIIARLQHTKAPNETFYKFGENYEKLEFCADEENGGKDDEEIEVIEPEEVSAPIVQQERKQEKVAKSETAKTLFRDSAAYDLVKFNGDDADYTELERKFSQPEFKDVDLVYYFNAVADWSDQTDTKRTANGWFATIRTFIRRDMEKGTVHKKNQEELIFGMDKKHAMWYLNNFE